ncbi:unnamed protein product [Dimorphilus gyrociliatus]|uniref:Uncharacterized protein n=1 Tax=Dimorphilus gyrociliatus TaxID=2664684 RepID=A0A7I8VE99_9ANNE|nr:unnamed protein product [Dimorphilus gyrociliatus]
MMDRLLTVERKVQQQADEIQVLKSSLADALRRLANVEHHPTSISSSSQMMMSSRTSTPVKMTRKAEPRLSKRTVSTDGIHRTTPSPTPSKGMFGKSLNMRKWPSVPHGEQAHNANGLSNSRFVICLMITTEVCTF